MHNIFGLTKSTLKRICQVSMCLYLTRVHYTLNRYLQPSSWYHNSNNRCQSHTDLKPLEIGFSHNFTDFQTWCWFLIIWFFFQKLSSLWFWNFIRLTINSLHMPTQKMYWYSEENLQSEQVNWVPNWSNLKQVWHDCDFVSGLSQGHLSFFLNDDFIATTEPETNMD